MGTLIGILLVTLLFLLFSSLTLPFPVNDSGVVRYNTTPWMTLILIGINTIIFLVWQAPDLIAIAEARTDVGIYLAQIDYATKLWTYGFRETYLVDGQSIGAFTSFTSMFMHADFGHLIGNMIYLWAFGRRVEDACGPFRYLLFYLLAGIVATMGYALLTDPIIDGPGVGASGAISGVMGAYLILFPFAKMQSLWGLAIIIRGISWVLSALFGGKVKWQWTVEIPVLLLLGFYIFTNLLPTFETIETGELAGGVNYVAHMTGFLSALTIFLFVRKDLLVRYFSGRSL